MRPTLLGPDDIARLLTEGHWSRETLSDGLSKHAALHPDRLACFDRDQRFTWAELEHVSDGLAAGLIRLGLPRGARALIQISSSCREMVLRIALKKAGIVGVFAPLQWRQRELDYVCRHTDPALLVLATEDRVTTELKWLDAISAHKIDLSPVPRDGWSAWDDAVSARMDPAMRPLIAERAFLYDDVSLITASSGTSGLAKLCEWPEAAQVCVGHLIAERLRITANDTVGIFSPLSGAAGVLVWVAHGTIPATFAFPDGYRAADLLSFAAKHGVSVATTVPVILARLAQEPLGDYDLRKLRALRVGTAAADMGAARTFEDATGCRVVVAAGSMECPGFAHAHIDEDRDTRLGGTIGLPLPGCRSRIDDETGMPLPAGEVGELKVSAPYAASGYWNDPDATRVAWQDGWYATGDMGSMDAAGRLRLLGRLKETINRSGLKILPAEVEIEIAKHPDVFEAAVIAAPDPEYGEVPCAFIQPRPGRSIDVDALRALLRETGIAHYKIPTRFIPVEALPRVNDSKVDKKALREQLATRPKP